MRVLVPIDGSACSFRVLEFATEHITKETYALNTIREAMRDVN